MHFLIGIPILIGVIYYLVFGLGWIIHIHMWDDSPTMEYTEEVLRKRNSQKTLFISDRLVFPPRSSSRRSSNKTIYIYRDLRYEAEIDISGTPVLHEIRAEIRCYYEQEKNPFVVVPEEEKCRYHSLEKGPKR